MLLRSVAEVFRVQAKGMLNGLIVYSPKVYTSRDRLGSEWVKPGGKLCTISRNEVRGWAGIYEASLTLVLGA